MDKLVFSTPTNGIPHNWEDLYWITGQGSYDGGIIKAIEGILSEFGDNFIVQGCVKTGSNYTAGWIFLDGELIKVDAHAATNTYWQKVTTYNSDGNKQTQLSGTVDIYQKNRATASAASGSMLADGNEARYLNPAWTTGAMINGWATAGVLKYRLHINDAVEIDLNLNTPLYGAQSSDILFTLPAGYRPVITYYKPIYNEGTYAFDLITFNSNGNISMDKTTAYTHHNNFRLPTV